MSSSSPQHEPTMEEILASIRKIISEDSTEAPAVPAPPAAPARVAPDPQDADVLELTQEVHEEPPPALPSPPPPVIIAAPPPPAPPEPVAQDADDVVFQPIEETPVSNPAPAPVASSAPVSSTEGIFSDKTRKALNDAFTSVDPDPEPDVRPAPSPAASVAPVDGRTLEAVFDHAVRETFDPVLQNWLEQNKDSVVERMKPVITQWLDEHFPALLEEAVRDELARAAKARVRR